MFSQKAYFHWYRNDGLNIGDFEEAREDLGFLEDDYIDVLSEPVSDTDSDEEEVEQFTVQISEN